MIIRPATHQDFAEIMLIAREECARYDYLRVDNDRLKASITSVLSSKVHLGLVAEDDGEIVGVLGAISTQNMWAQRQAASVVLLTGKAWAMKRMLGEFVSWVKSRRAVKVAGITFDLDGMEKLERLVISCGFEKRGGTCLLLN